MTNALQSVAYKLIRAKGAPVTFTQVNEGTYDATTGSAALTTVTATTYAVLDNYSSGIGGGTTFVGTLEEGDKRLWVPGAGLSFVPRPGDKVLADGITWLVISVNKINPDAVAYLYDVQVRQ